MVSGDRVAVSNSSGFNAGLGMNQSWFSYPEVSEKTDIISLVSDMPARERTKYCTSALHEIE